jgi:uncharacterized protein (DUF924 family)
MSSPGDILEFWFDQASDRAVINRAHPCYGRWFAGGAAVDDEIRRRFAGDVEAARRGDLDGWKSDRDGALAFIILTDQFPRHLYRQDRRAFESDRLAFDLATDLIRTGADEAYPLVRRVFLYLPLQHSEAIRDHELALERYMRLVVLAAEGGLPISSFCQAALVSEVEHIDTLRQFGRYCYRNVALGRRSTPEEDAYLAKQAA